MPEGEGGEDREGHTMRDDEGAILLEVPSILMREMLCGYEAGRRKLRDQECDGGVSLIGTATG